VAAFNATGVGEQKQQQRIGEKSPCNLHRLRVRPQASQTQAHQGEHREDHPPSRDQRFDMDL
jgi:hypothetical protein